MNSIASALPPGWSEASPGGMATNRDPVAGGIVDKNMTGLGWFIIFNDDAMETVEGLARRDEAFCVLAERMIHRTDLSNPTPLDKK